MRSQPLRVLLVEDSEDDAALVLRVLQRAGYITASRRVETKPELEAALADQEWQIVLSDYQLPCFSGLEAIQIMRQQPGDCPCILVSGTVGEEVAVEAVKAGAADFVLKDRLERLAVAIERQLQAVETRAHERHMLELARRNEELEQGRLQALRESRFKSKFLANVSHELRTPLNAIIGFSELLDQEYFGSINARQREYVGHVLNAGRHLVTLVNEILDLTKIEAGRFVLERAWIPFDTIVQGLEPVARGLASSYRVTFNLDVQAGIPELFIDPRRIHQALLNLVSNAIKFTPPTGTVTLRVRFDETAVWVECQDTGVGIRSEDLPRLFQEFEQIAPVAGLRVEGTGLGLALVRRLVALHDGSVGVTSEIGVGSTFTVRLPRAAPVLDEPLAVEAAS